MATTETESSQSTWQALKERMSQGATPYILMTAYAVIVPLLAIINMLINPRPTLLGDILFVLLLGTFLLLHKAPLSNQYKLTVGIILLGVVMPYFGTLNQFYMDVMTQVGMFVVLALGLNIVVGFAGLLDLGYIAFYAVGAYLWAIYSTPQARDMFVDISGNLPLGLTWLVVFVILALFVGAITGSLMGRYMLRLRRERLIYSTLGTAALFVVIAGAIWVSMSTASAPENMAATAEAFPLGPEWFIIFLPLTLVVGAITGILLGLPVLRLRGDYLAIVTLGFGEVIRVLANNLDRPIDITNGAQGIKSIGSPPLFLMPIINATGIDFNPAQISQLHFYVLVWVVVGLMLVVVTRLVNSRIGRAWTAIREDETAALAMGVPLVRMKLLAFATGASFAGVMGMIFAAKQTFINPPTFDLIRSIMILSMVILGGMGSVPGALLGATLVTLLNLQLLPRITSEMERLNLPATLDPAQYQRMIFGMLLILMTIFRPQGLLPENRRSQELKGEDESTVEDEEDEEDEDDLTRRNGNQGNQNEG
jgi:branched-chain amino acid transport system permease protein